MPSDACGKKKPTCRSAFSVFWCPEEDSNLHALQRWYLKLVRHQFRHLGSEEGEILKEKNKMSIKKLSKNSSRRSPLRARGAEI